MGAVVADQDISFQAMHQRLVQIVKVIDEDPAVDNALAFTGGNGATNTANSYIALKPLSERKISAQASHRANPQDMPPKFRVSASTCRRCRICASAAEWRTPSISTRCRAMISRS